MFPALVAALSVGASDVGDSAVADWANIDFTSTSGGSRTTSSTVTFTSGGTREILVNHDITIGSLSYKIASGPYTIISSGSTFDITTGLTVTFKYTCFFDSEGATVEIRDNTLDEQIDTFTCAFTFLG